MWTRSGESVRAALGFSLLSEDCRAHEQCDIRAEDLSRLHTDYSVAEGIRLTGLYALFSVRRILLGREVNLPVTATGLYLRLYMKYLDLISFVLPCLEGTVLCSCVWLTRPTAAAFQVQTARSYAIEAISTEYSGRSRLTMGYSTCCHK